MFYIHDKNQTLETLTLTKSMYNCIKNELEYLLGFLDVEQAIEYRYRQMNTSVAKKLLGIHEVYFQYPFYQV